MTPFWASGYLDLDPASYDVGVAFWRDVTGWQVSPSRGEAGEFATFVPPAGDPHLLVQRLAAGPSRIHVDLHVDDPQAAAERAVRLGARVVADLGLGGDGLAGRLRVLPGAPPRVGPRSRHGVAGRAHVAGRPGLHRRARSSSTTARRRSGAS